MIFDRVEGGSVVFEDDGSIRIRDFPTIKRIDLQDLIKVQTHRILRDDEGAIHEIEFVNGGHVRLSYTFTGKLRQLTGFNVRVNIQQDNVIIFRSSDS